MTQPRSKQRSVPHMEGPTFLSYSPDGAKIVTGGLEGLIKIHNTSDPSAEPKLLDQDFGMINEVKFLVSQQNSFKCV